MSTKLPPKNDSAQDDPLPGDWERVDDDLAHGVRERFEHPSGLVVTVAHQSRPTQMHDPMTADTDSGYVARVRDDVEANISPQLSAKSVARKAAREFMCEHPDGEFDVPEPSEQPYGDAAIDWRNE